jgi:hypothetical protein
MLEARSVASPRSVDQAEAGYQHQAYAASLSGFGTPFRLERARGWLLRRRIPSTEVDDAMGPYPMLCCGDWAGVRADLEELENSVVSVVAVIDPFGEYDKADLESAFPDALTVFKPHFVTDLSLRQGAYVDPHHRRNATRGLRELQIDLSRAPLQYLDDWNRLYTSLKIRHEITGLRAFSASSFAQQLAVPGMVAFRATRGGATVGMLLWYVQGDVAHYHLGASDTDGYRLHASFALFDAAIDHFSATGVQWLDLGGEAGVNPKNDGGLARFKRGWSTGSRSALLGGRICNRDAYDELTRGAGLPPTSYFPRYRAGEYA